MNCPSERFWAELATPQADPGLRRVLASGDFTGGIRVRYLREPSPLASFQREGREALVFVLVDRQTEEAAGMGAVVLREVAVGGRRTTLGYLCSLRVRPEYRGRFQGLAAVYRELHRRTGDRVGLYLTTILAGNDRALRLLQARRPGMPEYRPLGLYHTWFLPTGGRGPDLGGLEDPLRYEALRSQRDGMLWDPFSCGLEAAEYVQTPRGLGYLVDQRDHKQYRVLSYGGWMRVVSWLPVHWLGYPRLPRPGTDADCVSGAILSPDPGDQGRILRELQARARGRDFLMVGCLAGDPLDAVLARARGILYRSHLFAVLFEGMEPPDLHRLHLDVALL